MAEPRLLPALDAAYVKLAAAKDIETAAFADAAEAVLPLFDKLGAGGRGRGERGRAGLRGHGSARLARAPPCSLERPPAPGLPTPPSHLPALRGRPQSGR
jgi:hypothetical protein